MTLPTRLIWSIKSICFRRLKIQISKLKGSKRLSITTSIFVRVLRSTSPFIARSTSEPFFWLPLVREPKIRTSSIAAKDSKIVQRSCKTDDFSPNCTGSSFFRLGIKKMFQFLKFIVIIFCDGTCNFFCQFFIVNVGSSVPVL